MFGPLPFNVAMPARTSLCISRLKASLNSASGWVEIWAVPRIALAAPTGRAAERMAESLRGALERLRGIDGIDGLVRAEADGEIQEIRPLEAEEKTASGFLGQRQESRC